MTGQLIRGPWRALPHRKGWPPPAAYVAARERLGHNRCGHDCAVVDSPFRRAAGIRPRYECQLRTLAREQAMPATGAVP
jgi:hypothetical protein